MLMLTTPTGRHLHARPASVLPPLTAAEYLTLRRKAAGMSIADLARALVTVAAHRRPIPHRKATLRETTSRFERMRDELKLLEQPGSVARPGATLDAIRSVMAFDPDVYRQLATEAADRHPRVCRGCACSDHDSCVSDVAVCRWVAEDRCSRCADGEQA